MSLTDEIGYLVYKEERLHKALEQNANICLFLADDLCKSFFCALYCKYAGLRPTIPYSLRTTIRTNKLKNLRG